MPRLSVSKEKLYTALRRQSRYGVGALAAGAVLFGTIAADVQAASPPAPTFDSAFSVKGEPAALYYKVSYKAHDGAHTLQVWREGQSKLRRRTDDAVDTYVLRTTSDPGEYQMIVVDYQKRITTRIDRNNLIRLGHFSDWFDLAHGLRHPAGQYTLSVSEAPPNTLAPIAKCRWYELQQGNAADRICWSDRERLPLVIWSLQKGTVWRVLEAEHRPLPDDTFQLHDAGFVRNDANADIDND